LGSAGEKEHLHNSSHVIPQSFTAFLARSCPYPRFGADYLMAGFGRRSCCARRVIPLKRTRLRCWRRTRRMVTSLELISAVNKCVRRSPAGI